jgi:HD-GYP domain-containing protein (c-di-GMP phosphodiesterase class II)
VPAHPPARAAPTERTRVVHRLPSWRGLDPSPWPPGADDDAIARLLDLAEEAAPDVAAHMERTSRLIRLFAVEADLPDTLVRTVIRTARLHDIGKLAIPPWVLEKPGPLSEVERRLIRGHPVMGQRMVERKAALMSLGPLIRATHERWDGNGYPDRLKGAAIPLPSRIVAVGDAFDAMTSVRVYGPAKTGEEALAELRRGAGAQFDPGAVALFCNAFENRIDLLATEA